MTGSDYEDGRRLMAQMIPAAPLDLFDRLGDEMRNWYIDEARQMKAEFRG